MPEIFHLSRPVTLYFHAIRKKNKAVFLRVPRRDKRTKEECSPRLSRATRPQQRRHRRQHGPRVDLLGSAVSETSYI